MNFFQKIPIFFFSLLYPIKVYGKENIPKGGAVLVSNHFRAIDCGFIARICDKDIKYLAKKEIFKNKLFSKIVRSYGGIPIDRDNPDMKSLLEAIKEIKKGNKLCIFPEGTRNVSGTADLQEIKGGSVIFSVKAKCPIVPIMMLKKAKMFSRTKIIIGKPFELSDYYGKKLSEEDIKALDQIVREKMIEQQNMLKQLSSKGKK
ncbi:MAG: 1-acyl-sn-glycerol-3-phosphate acyltransferase [Clostridiales bacterium]|nr:1-acyl-sn-glycerol-3-phosphate acyltransferase [Clostridiales bacterium]